MAPVPRSWLMTFVLFAVLSAGEQPGANNQKTAKSKDFVLEVKPAVIAPGEKAVLHWSIKGATEVVIEQISGSSPVLRKIGTFGASGSLQVQPKEDTNYVLSCEVSTTHACASVTLHVRIKQR